MNKLKELQRQKAFDDALNYFSKHLAGMNYGHLQVRQTGYTAWVRCEPDNKAERQDDGYIDVSIIMLARQHNRTGLRLWVYGDKKRKAIVQSGIKGRLASVPGLKVEASINHGTNPNTAHALYDFYRDGIDWESGLSAGQIKLMLDDYLRIEDDLRKNGFLA